MIALHQHAAHTSCLRGGRGMTNSRSAPTNQKSSMAGVSIVAPAGPPFSLFCSVRTAFCFDLAVVRAGLERRDFTAGCLASSSLEESRSMPLRDDESSPDDTSSTSELSSSATGADAPPVLLARPICVCHHHCVRSCVRPRMKATAPRTWAMESLAPATKRCSTCSHIACDAISLSLRNLLRATTIWPSSSSSNVTASSPCKAIRHDTSAPRMPGPGRDSSHANPPAQLHCGMSVAQHGHVYRAATATRRRP